MARINVEQKALSDPRFTALARLLDLADADHALGKMVRLWNTCQEIGRYTLPRSVVVAVFDDERAPAALTEVALAKNRNRGTVYLCGTRGRIEWLKKRRADGKKGGRPRNPRVLPPANPPAPAPAPALFSCNASSKSKPPDSKSRARVNGEKYPPGFQRWWIEIRAWFKLANCRLGYKQDAGEKWKALGCEEHADAIIQRTIKQRQHYADSQRSGGSPPRPQDPHRYLKNRRFNDEIP